MSLDLFCIPIYLDLFLPYYYVLYFVYHSAFFPFFLFLCITLVHIGSIEYIFPLSSSEKSESCPVVSDSLRLHGLWLARLLCPWNSPGKSTGVGSHSLLQGLVPTQGSNPGLTHCRQILYKLSHQGSPLLEIIHFYSFFFFKMVYLIPLTCILVLKLTSLFLCLLNKVNVIIPLIIQSF